MKIFFIYFAVHNVTAHISRIQTDALCKFPKPKIIPILAASKTYFPHCTVLHRCGDDTGCCHTDALTCVPKHTATVVLYFYVSYCLSIFMMSCFIQFWKSRRYLLCCMKNGMCLVHSFSKLFRGFCWNKGFWYDGINQVAQWLIYGSERTKLDMKFHRNNTKGTPKTRAKDLKSFHLLEISVGTMIPELLEPATRKAVY